MRTSTFLRIVPLLLALAACQGSPSVPPVEATRGTLEGTWRWVSSKSVSTGQVHSPAGDGFDAHLVFEADDERSGTFTYTRLGRTVTGRYGIASEDQPGNDFIFLDRGIDFLARNAWLTVGRDTMILGGVMEGGYETRYARAKP